MRDARDLKIDVHRDIYKPKLTCNELCGLWGECSLPHKVLQGPLTLNRLTDFLSTDHLAKTKNVDELKIENILAHIVITSKIM